MDAKANGQAAKHSIPAIDRMMELLTELERHSAGLTISELTGLLKFPRTTVYRILNTLQQHEVVRRTDDGTYHLGRRLLSLAANTSTRFSEINLAATCQPVLDRLAAELGDGIKLSVLDADGVLVLLTASGRRDYALTVTPGQHMPMHSGAAGKLLLANQPAERIDYWLSRPLPAFTGKTITDPKKLRTELARIRRQGWAEDRGENGLSIYAYAAPVTDGDGTVIAAVSVPFLARTPENRMAVIKAATIRAASAISVALQS